jgi:hypothetical protein
MKNNLLLKNILDDEFLENLAKSADLYKIGSNSVLDPEEIRIGLKVVPRAVMSILINELVPMEVNAHKDIQLPFGKVAYVRVNKNAADDFTGSVYSDNKLVYDFKNRSIPGLGIILLSTFELYDMEELATPQKDDDIVARKVQKLIDERMELHSLVSRVVEDKMAQREAIHKIMMAKLNDAIATKSASIPSIATQSPNIVTIPQKPLDLKNEDIVKKEAALKKGSPLKDFLDRKKKPKEHHVEMTKSEVVDCDSCGQTIFGDGGFSGCLCFGQDMGRKIWIKKSDNDVQLRFSRGWSEDNIEMLLETLRGRNGKY